MKKVLQWLSSTFPTTVSKVTAGVCFAIIIAGGTAVLVAANSSNNQIESRSQDTYTLGEEVDMSEFQSTESEGGNEENPSQNQNSTKPQANTSTPSTTSEKKNVSTQRSSSTQNNTGTHNNSSQPDQTPNYRITISANKCTMTFYGKAGFSFSLGASDAPNSIGAGRGVGDINHFETMSSDTFVWQTGSSPLMSGLYFHGRMKDANGNLVASLDTPAVTATECGPDSYFL